MKLFSLLPPNKIIQTGGAFSLDQGMQQAIISTLMKADICHKRIGSLNCNSHRVQSTQSPFDLLCGSFHKSPSLLPLTVISPHSGGISLPLLLSSLLPPSQSGLELIKSAGAGHRKEIVSLTHLLPASRLVLQIIVVSNTFFPPLFFSFLLDFLHSRN